MTIDHNHGGDRIILIRKVWSLHTETEKQSPGFGSRIRHVATKFPHISSENHHNADEHAKLLLLTSKALALLDPQHDSKESHPVHYTVPLHHCSEDIMVDESTVVIEYLASVHQSDSRVPKKDVGVAKVFGILSPLSQTPEKKPTSNHDVEDTMILHARLHASSNEDAHDIAQSISEAVARLNNSMEFLDYGFPFPPMTATVEQILLGKNTILADMPEVNEKVVVQGDDDVGFVVSSPMGTCAKAIPVGELAKACGTTKIVRIHPRHGQEKNALFHSRYAVDLRYSAERLPDACEQTIRTHISSVPSEVMIGIGAAIFMLVLEYFGFSQRSMIALTCVYLSVGIKLLYTRRWIKRYAMWYTSAHLVEVSKTSNQDRLQKRMSLRRCITLQQSLVRGKNGVVLDDEKSLSMVADAQLKVSPEELLRLQEMRDMSPAINVDLFMRYIKACRGDRELALQRLYDTAEWRQMNNVDSILDSKMPYFRDLKEHYVHSVIGRSKDGLPVVVEGMGGFRKTMVALRAKGIIPEHKEEVMRQFTFVIEWITRVLEPSEFPRGQFIRIYDMKGIHLSDVGDHEAVQLGKEMMEVLELYYPERMAKAYVVNCPKYFAALWSVAKPLLDPQTSNKITLISKFKNILPALRKDIDDDVIPKAYGGNGIDNWYDSKEEEEIFALATGGPRGGLTIREASTP